MHEELIETLRNCANVNSLSRYKRDLMKQAADAIKKLSRELEYANEWNRAMYDALPKWIPVTARLPEENGRYLVVLKRYGFVDDIKLNDEQIRILRYHDGWRLPCHIQKWINETLKQEVTYWMQLPSTEGLNET